MIRLRTSSVAPCNERARRTCIGSSASFRICGASPLVETVMCRAPMLRPHDALMIRIARINLGNLIRAIRIINASWGLGIGARHITVSTSGLAPQIRKLADEQMQVRLALSLHGATDEVRNRIMPINRRYNIDMLLSACDYYTSRKKQRLTFEYILIAGV